MGCSGLGFETDPYDIIRACGIGACRNMVGVLRFSGLGPRLKIMLDALMHCIKLYRRLHTSGIRVCKVYEGLEDFCIGAG